jgi:chromosome segregation ATPase
VSLIVILIIGLIEVAAIVFALIKLVGGSDNISKELEESSANLEKQIVDAKTRVESSLAEMRPLGELQKLVLAARIASDTLKADRGRVTITQAELETVETRLRELEEIERELEASGIETEEEVKILTKKEQELAAKNAALKEQIRASTDKMDALLGELQNNAEAQEQVLNLKTQLILSEQKTEEMVVQIELGNDQYFDLKRRYDALDIEYAQLYEKFSESEAMLNRGK